MQQTTAVMVSGTFPLLLLAKHSHTYTTVYRLSAAQMAFKALFFTLLCLTLLRHSNSFASGVHCSSSTGTNHQKGTRLKDWKLKISDLDEGWDQEDLEKEVTELTVQMMKIDSTTGHEGRVVWFLKEYLEERGWDVMLQEVDGDLCRDEGAPPRANLLATRPGEGPPRLLFNTHTDTVPPYLPPRVEGGTIWGRGACDAKGIAAAQVAAAARLARRGITGVGLLLVAGEEVDHAGARAAAALGLAPAYVVIGEPTEGRQVRLQKGLLKLRLTTAGKACHSGYPEEGHSAIDDLVELLHELKHEAWPSDPALGATTLNIGLLRGGQAANALAERAEATLMFRAVGQPAKLRARVERAVAKYPGATLAVVTANSPVRLHLSASQDARSAVTAAFNTDAAYLDLGDRCKQVLVGPGSILHAHCPTEQVGVAELAAAARQYARLAVELLAEEEEEEGGRGEEEEAPPPAAAAAEVSSRLAGLGVQGGGGGMGRATAAAAAAEVGEEEEWRELQRGMVARRRQRQRGRRRQAGDEDGGVGGSAAEAVDC